MNHRIIFIFLDGFGLGKADLSNPHQPGSMPFLQSRLGRPLVQGPGPSSDEILLKAIDATLGVPGIPQSATGQTALFTGVNAARELGRHYPAFPNKQLVELIYRHNIYDKIAGVGKTSIFANAYSKLYFHYVQERRRRHSVTTHCLLAAGLPILTLEEMKAGRAVFWDITREALGNYPVEETFPVIEPETAGRHLAGLTDSFDLVVFESFLPDLAGHKRDMNRARDVLRVLDRFIQGVYENLRSDATMLVTSDHGNIEDLSTGQHTMNPVPLLVMGKAVPFFLETTSIFDITPCILKALF